MNSKYIYPLNRQPFHSPTLKRRNIRFRWNLGELINLKCNAAENVRNIKNIYSAPIMNLIQAKRKTSKEQVTPFVDQHISYFCFALEMREQQMKRARDTHTK